MKISSQEGGYIKQVPFKSGANVSKGDLLLQIDDDEEQAQLKEIEARLVVAQKAYERFKALKQKQYVSEADFEKKEGEYLSLLAQRERIKVRITHKKIVAPFSGIVGFKELSPGAFVKSGQELVQLDSVKPIYVDFKVNEKHINLLNEGSSVEVEVEGFPDNVYNAEVVAIEPMADEIGHSVRVRASIENVMDELRSGFYAKVKFMEAEFSDTMVVPESAVEADGSVEYVYVVHEGRAVKAPIKTGKRNGKMVQILQGLLPGLVVITTGQTRISENYPVIPKNQSPKSVYA